MPQSVRWVGIRAAFVAVLLACGGGGSKSTTLPPDTSGWWRDRVVYEVFVRSFADSGVDGVGDLAGLTAHLDYLNDGNPATTSDLGVGAIWLMPIFPSPSYHGYDVTDYHSVNPQYGTLQDFDAFVTQAHQRGIKVILDMVLNHSSSQHPWFVDSRSGPTSTRRDWYDWSATIPWTVNTGLWRPYGGAYYYAYFTASMPDLNLGNAAVEQELVDSMKFWLARGVDGFRLDAVRHYFESATGAVVDQPATHDFLRRIRATLQRDYPETLLVAEAWTGEQTVATYYGNGDEVQLAFSFDLAEAMKTAALLGDGSGVVNTIARTETALAGKDRGFEAPFLSNHDQVRTLRAIGGDAGAARVAAAALFAMPGTPFVYYGEELGMQGGLASDDRQKRTPMRWTPDASTTYGFTAPSANPWFTGDAPEAAGVDVATEQAQGGSLWTLYRRLIRLRNGTAALARGDATRPGVTGGGVGLVALVRSYGGKRVLFVGNFSTADTGPFTVDLTATPATLEQEGLDGAPAIDAGMLSFPGLAARGFAFVSLD